MHFNKHACTRVTVIYRERNKSIEKSFHIAAEKQITVSSFEMYWTAAGWINCGKKEVLQLGKVLEELVQNNFTIFVVYL